MLDAASKIMVCVMLSTCWHQHFTVLFRSCTSLQIFLTSTACARRWPLPGRLICLMRVDLQSIVHGYIVLFYIYIYIYTYICTVYIIYVHMYICTYGLPLVKSLEDVSCLEDIICSAHSEVEGFGNCRFLCKSSGCPLPLQIAAEC